MRGTILLRGRSAKKGPFMKILPIQVLAFALAFNAHVVHADAPSFIAAASIQQLKYVYLRCAETSSNEVLDRGTAAQCSLVADALRDRGFEGSFERMLLWWHVARQAGAERAREDADPAATPALLR
ncbi:hypothetical protein SAMN05444679_121112 [Variovorax sp. CF079]|nr:hypothetical protein SAMN05444679_121112 [Variovorax sp. CF079]